MTLGGPVDRTEREHRREPETVPAGALAAGVKVRRLGDRIGGEEHAGDRSQGSGDRDAADRDSPTVQLAPPDAPRSQDYAGWAPSESGIVFDEGTRSK